MTNSSDEQMNVGTFSPIQALPGQLPSIFSLSVSDKSLSPMFVTLNSSIIGEQVKHMPRLLPGTFYASFARDSRPVMEKARNVPFDIVQKQMVRCFTVSINYKGSSKAQVRLLEPQRYRF